MKISYNWLKDYLGITANPADLSKVLTDCGLEVEGMEKHETLKGSLKGIVVGEVLEVKSHPNADKLRLTRVNTGNRVLHIVCGASNVAPGQKVAVAVVGTTLYMGDRTLEIKETAIRGENSEGMICAEDEIGLGKSHAGIMVLDPAAIPGDSLSQYFDTGEDTIFEIGLTPNRADAASHLGVARDLAAVFSIQPGMGNTAVERPDVGDFIHGEISRAFKVIIEDPEACRRYAGVTLSGVLVEESPVWLKNRLTSVGVRPINNLVDIGNYVMLETGQPLHIFDADQVADDTVIIKKLSQGTSFVTLDEVKRQLSNEDLMICDSAGGMCIAGVFGGVHSGVTEKTVNVFIESAWFDPVHIRRTSKRHGLKTDASFRFERGVDPEMTVYALKRAALLIKEIAGGVISSEVIDVYPLPYDPAIISLEYNNINRLIGKSIPRAEIKAILTALNFSIKTEDEAGLTVTVPSYKVDVTREADVIEEILRIYGYNNIAIPGRLNASVVVTPKPDRERLHNRISGFLSSNGFYEIMCNSLVSSNYSDKIDGFDPGLDVKILNPISQDLDVMRQSLLFGAMEALAFNRNRQHPDQRFYEFGTVYSLGNSGNGLLKGYQEAVKLSLLMSGKRDPENWNTAGINTGFFDLKHHVTAIINMLYPQRRETEITESAAPCFEYGITFTAAGITIGQAGKLSPKTLKVFDIRDDVFYAELDWASLVKLNTAGRIAFRELPRFPEVRRDLALVVDEGITFAQLSALAYTTAGPILKDVNLFDVYQGDKIGEGKKSYAMSFILRDELKTLTDKEIESVMQKLIAAYSGNFKASLR